MTPPFGGAAAVAAEKAAEHLAQLKPTGSKYDAHHIQPLENNGGNIWQNITPARYPEQHQGDIHRADGPLRNLQKKLDR
ncbi:hypothetical protein [Neisseria sp.]